MRGKKKTQEENGKEYSCREVKTAQGERNKEEAERLRNKTKKKEIHPNLIMK